MPNLNIVILEWVLLFTSAAVMTSSGEVFNYISKVHPQTQMHVNLLVTWSLRPLLPKWFCQHFKPASSMSGLATAMSTWPLSFTGRVTLKSSSKACFLLWINSVQTLLTAFMRSWRPRKWNQQQQKHNLSKTQYKGSNFLHAFHLRISSTVLKCQKKKNSSDSIKFNNQIKLR